MRTRRWRPSVFAALRWMTVLNGCFADRKFFRRSVISYLMLADRIEEALEVRDDHAPLLR